MKVEFLKRLFLLGACQDDLINFLKTEKLINDFQLTAIFNESDKAKYLQNLLEELKRSDKLLLLDYEWSILPVERLKLTVVTERNSREFTYNT
jgi:hypothetical protein